MLVVKQRLWLQVSGSHNAEFKPGWRFRVVEVSIVRQCRPSSTVRAVVAGPMILAHSASADAGTLPCSILLSTLRLVMCNRVVSCVSLWLFVQGNLLTVQRTGSRSCGSLVAVGRTNECGVQLVQLKIKFNEWLSYPVSAVSRCAAALTPTTTYSPTRDSPEDEEEEKFSNNRVDTRSCRSPL